MVAHGGLGNIAAGVEVARADAIRDCATGGAGPARRNELAEDREAGGIGCSLEEEGIRVGQALHAGRVLTTIDIVKYQCSTRRHGSEARSTMNTTPELVALIQRDREQHIQRDHLARLAACANACCNPSLINRLARALRGSPADC